MITKPNMLTAPLIFALSLFFSIAAHAPVYADIVIWSENFDSTATNSLPTGWSGTAQNGGPAPKVTTYYGRYAGDHVLAMEEFNPSHETQFVTDFIDFSSYTGHTITLKFDLRYEHTYEVDQPDTSLIVGFTESGIRPFGISDWVGGNHVGAPPENSIYSPYIPPQWFTVTLDLTDRLAQFPNTDGIGMKIWQMRGVPDNAYLDNMQIIASPVPEPSSVALLAGSALALGLWRRHSITRAATRSPTEN